MDNESRRFLPSALQIGVAEIDAQHNALFRHLVQLKGVCLRQGHLATTDAESLMEELRQHYATEERLAQTLGVDFTDHARDHREMLEQVEKSLNDAVVGRGNVFATLRYVEYWFERHIVQDDMCLGQHSAAAKPE